MAQGTFTDFWARMSGGLQNIAPEIFGYPKSPTTGVETTDLPPVLPGTGPSPAETGSGSRFDIGRSAYRFFVDRGLTPEQAQEWAGNFAWESGGRTNAVRENDNPTATDAPHSAGIAQWNGPRLRGLVDYARSQGINIPEGRLNDPSYVRQAIAQIPLQTQLEYAWQESQGPERRAFTGITSPTPALGAISFFRPRGWTETNPAGGEAFENRRALGRRVRELEDRQVMVDRSADAGYAPDPALERVPAPMGAVPSTPPSAPGPAPAYAGGGPAGFPQTPAMTPGGRADPFAGLNVQRTANPQGSITGLIDRIMGVPNRADLAASLEATTSTEARNAIARITQRAGQIAAQNPNMQPQQLYSTMIADPQIGVAMARVPPAQAVTVLQSLAQNAGRPVPEFRALGPGQAPGAVDPRTGVFTQTGPARPPADVQEIEYEMDLYRRNPEEYARYRAARAARTGAANTRPSAEVITGGSERARSLGLGLREGERAEVKFERDPFTGRDRVVDLSFPDRPPVDLSQLAAAVNARETTERLVRDRSQIQTRQDAVLAAARIAERINTQLDVTGETAQGILGVVTRATEGITAQVVDAARIAGVPLDPAAYSASLQPFVRAGANSAATQSNIVALAFMLARAQNPSGQITQRDLDNALTQLGSGMTGSTSQMRASLQEMMRNAINSVNDAVTIRSQDFAGSSVQPPRRMDEILTAEGLTRYLQPRPPLGTSQRPFEPNAIERMGMAELQGLDAKSLTPQDAVRVYRRYLALKQIEQTEPLPSPAR